MYDYDVIFIGSGHSCNHGAGTLAAAGKKVALVEMEKITLLNILSSVPVSAIRNMNCRR